MDNINEVKSDNEILIIEELAREIWKEHYTPIIGSDQVEYMLDKYQSRESIFNQIREEGYTYFLVQEDGKYIGYIGIQLREDELFLSKIYIRDSKRGKGFGRKAIDYLQKLAKKNNIYRISLTVNKNNINSIKVYEKIGFDNQGPVVQDIGNGFVMDDYKMVKTF